MNSLPVVRWQDVPAKAIELRNKTADLAAKVKERTQCLPREGFLALWHNHAADKLLLNFGDWTKQAEIELWREVLAPLAGRVSYDIEFDRPGGSDGPGAWVKIAFCYCEMPSNVKEAHSAAIRSIGQAAGLLPGGWADAIPGGPTPLTGTLAGGMLGATLGYGGGWLASQALPRHWDRRRLRRLGAVLGGLTGASPGLALLANNLQSGQPLNSGHLLNWPVDEAMKHSPVLGDGQPNPDYVPNMPYVPKEAASRTGFELYRPMIPLDRVTATVLYDPVVSEQLSPRLRAATTGLMEAAYAEGPGRQNGPRLIGPADIARISAGMGAGYLSGALVGRVLGTLAGMPDETQDVLKRTGIWAGAIANIVPLAFGAR